MNKLFALSLSALVFASCENSANRRVMEPAPSSPSILSTSTVAKPDSVTTATATNPPASSAATVTLNPQHGAPGHRCDIPVGSPLNSPAGTVPAPVSGSNPSAVMQPTPAPSQPVNKQVRLNPAHGAPGHDCSIPVGQPLKS